MYSGPSLMTPDIYNNEKITKSHVYLLTINSNGIDSIFNAVDKKRHAFKRKLLGRAVTERAMRTFEPVMQEQVDVFLEKLYESSQASRPVDMTQSCKRLGFDIVGHLVFGFALNTQTDPTYRFIIDGVAMGNYGANACMQLPVLKNQAIRAVRNLIPRSPRTRYLRLQEDIFRTRLSLDKHAKNDLYSSVADHIDSDGPISISLDEFWSEAMFFFPAGGDTTATALSALFFYLSRSPEVYRKLSGEIRGAFTHGAEIRGGPKLAGCRYLRACIDEALRMSPPVSGTLWRERAPGGSGDDDEASRAPLVVDGHVVPRGVQVGVNIYALHHNEAYFPEPFAFRPERWLVGEDGAGADALRRMHAAFAPFSTGARGCAGKPMAYLESSLVAAQTLWYFDFETAPGDTTGAGVPGRTDGRDRPGEYQLRDIFGAGHEGPNLVFRARGDVCKDFEDKKGI